MIDADYKMLKKYIKLTVLTAILAVIFAVLFAGCSGSDVESDVQDFVIDKDAKLHYNVIYGKNASDELLYHTSIFCKELKEKCNVSASVLSDYNYSRPNDTSPVRTVEILIGQTERQQSIDLYKSLSAKNEYVIKVDGDKLVFGATTEKLLIEALTAFKQEYFEHKTLNITIPGDFEYHSSHSFFNIAKNGVTETTIVVPYTVAPDVKNLVSMIASKINNLCNTAIKVVYPDETDSFEGCILVGDIDDPDVKEVMQGLEKNQFVIKYVKSKLIIAGNSDKDVANGVISFMGEVILKRDKTNNGNPYVYFPTNLEISEVYDGIIPIIPGGVVMESVTISQNLLSLKYGDITKDGYKLYIELIKSLGFIVDEKSTDELMTASASYSYSENGNNILCQVFIEYNKQSKEAIVKISKT